MFLGVRGGEGWGGCRIRVGRLFGWGWGLTRDNLRLEFISGCVWWVKQTKRGGGELLAQCGRRYLRTLLDGGDWYMGDNMTGGGIYNVGFDGTRGSVGGDRDGGRWEGASVLRSIVDDLWGRGESTSGGKGDKRGGGRFQEELRDVVRVRGFLNWAEQDIFLGARVYRGAMETGVLAQGDRGENLNVGEWRDLKLFSLTLEEFGQILKIHFKGQVSYTDMWLLDYLSISAPSKGRYKTTLPSPNVIKYHIQIPQQGLATRTKNKKTIIVDKNQILTREIQPHMKPWVDIIRENAVCLGGHRDHVSACLCRMLYCIESSTPYNLKIFILKIMEKTRNKPKELLPYVMLLTRLFKHVVSVFPELVIDHYLSHDRVMHPLTPYYERKMRSDHGKKRPHESNASSSSTTLNHPSSSHPLDDIINENDE
ncbi:hypothetical protein Tco_0255839 [Tanacetum coccineum]